MPEPNIDLLNVPKKNLENFDDWDELIARLADLRRKIITKAKQKVEGVAWAWFNERASEFKDKIKTNVPEYNKYVGWHGLSGSSIAERKQAPNLDFTGEYSEYNVETFLNGLLDELNEMADKKDKN